mmetsp:Transcript_15868/g.20724  ORF Transcript_15868/g.20724 Transcript_15868/m.20724 type:complete len:231 (+) Transcript_15868:102-794(+)|eukprot:CAMPEP_0198150826 /NCGR_PEP_ID=MMETSP1443-20131203/52679_1 /TAXON_ID=186043 /ORGANISM="Entomoneis sp., Strain CCMP2396" /LENGTH=230 /DNA_ID=CAMNT_0043816263 /DNA_START=87 /DNA_END=779 /DNA_ORIENTATION=+
MTDQQQQYGVHARDLIAELKRSLDQNTNGEHNGDDIVMPSYNDKLVHKALQDLQIHVQALQDIVEANGDQDKISTNVRPSIIFHKAAIKRNKRALLAYHNVRLNVISDAYWASSGQADLKDSGTLAPAEQVFCTQYERLVQNYTMSTSLSDDMRSHHRHPPQPVDKVQVRVCVGSQGAIVLESGQTVDLVKGAVHYLLFTDVESMLRDGSVELLTAEEDINHHPTAVPVV